MTLGGPDPGLLEGDDEAELSPAAALAPYLRAIRAHIVLVVAIVAVSVAGSLAWIQHRTTSYEAQAQILLTPLGPSDVTFAGLPLLKAVGPDPARVVNTAASIIDSPAAARLTANEVGHGQTGGSVSAAVAVTPQPNSDIVNVTAQAPTGPLAAELATGYAGAALDVRARELQPLVEEAIATTKREMSTVAGQATGTIGKLRARLNALKSIRDGGDPTMSLSHPATVPSAPLGTPAMVLVVIAFLAGVAIAAVAAVLIELLVPRPIVDEAELLDAYPIPILARVPDAPRRGRTLRATPTVAEAYRSLRGQLEFRKEKLRRETGDGGGRTTTVLVTSGSKGDGRTTAAVNLAYAVTRAGNTAIVVDLDVRAPGVARACGIEPAADLSALLRSSTSLSGVLAARPGLPRLSVLAAPLAPDMDMVEAVARVAPAIVTEAGGYADWVIVDAPPLGEVSDALALMGVVDHLVLVSRLGNATARGLARVRELLEWLGWTPDGHVVIGGRPTTRSDYLRSSSPPAEASEPATGVGVGDS